MVHVSGAHSSSSHSMLTLDGRLASDGAARKDDIDRKPARNRNAIFFIAILLRIHVAGETLLQLQSLCKDKAKQITLGITRWNSSDPFRDVVE